MEKVIHINIGNYTFVIEEPAYEMLKKYMDALGAHFNNTEGKDEIVSDIETRIGELLNRKITEHKKVIQTADIQEVLNQMGNPADISEEGHATESASGNQERYNDNQIRRRVFRDPDNCKIGGVCGGIAAYFDIDPMWLRLAFILSLLFFGTGVLLYIILWVILPEATTASEKLEMRGETVDVNNIEKTIKENLNRVKTDFKNYYEQQGKSTIRNGARTLSGLIADIFHQVGYMVIRFIGGALLIFGLMMLVIWIKTMLFSNSNGLSSFITGIFDESWQKQLARWSVFAACSVPLLGIAIAGFQMLFGINYKNKPLKYTLNLILTAAIITMIYLGYVSFENFSVSSSTQQKIVLQNDSAANITLVFDDDEHFDQDHEVTFTQNSLFYLNDNDMRTGNIHVVIRPSENDSNYLVQKNSAFGVDANNARMLTRRINYSYIYQNNKLLLNNYATYKKNDVWRNQKVELILYLAKGAKLSWNSIPNNVHFHPNLANEAAEEDYYDDNCKQWRMTGNGLECIK